MLWFSASDGKDQPCGSVLRSRLKERLEQGMMEEVKNLHSAGLTWAKLESFGLEYRFISQYLQNKITFDEMKNKLNTSYPPICQKTGNVVSADGEKGDSY